MGGRKLRGRPRSSLSHASEPGPVSERLSFSLPSVTQCLVTNISAHTVLAVFISPSNILHGQAAGHIINTRRFLPLGQISGQCIYRWLIIWATTHATENRKPSVLTGNFGAQLSGILSPTGWARPDTPLQAHFRLPPYPSLSKIVQRFPVLAREGPLSCLHLHRGERGRCVGLEGSSPCYCSYNFSTASLAGL